MKRERFDWLNDMCGGGHVRPQVILFGEARGAAAALRIRRSCGAPSRRRDGECDSKHEFWRVDPKKLQWAANQSLIGPILSLLFFAVFSLSCRRIGKPMNECLQQFESVAHMATNGEVLAIAIGFDPPFSKDSVLPKHEGGVVLVRQGMPTIRTPLKVGAMRSIIATSSGFVAARVTEDKDSRSMAHLLEIDLFGKVTELPPLEIDLVGLWVAHDGTLYVYSSQLVFRWVRANQRWEKLPLNLMINSEAIRKIVSLRNGLLLLITDRGIKGFRELGEPALFVKRYDFYPNPVKVFGFDHWWLASTDGSVYTISIIGINGESVSLGLPPLKLVTDIKFGVHKAFIICAGDGGNIHDSFYYVLNDDGSGALRGPFKLPDDTKETCIWGDYIVSSGVSSGIYKLKIEH